MAHDETLCHTGHLVVIEMQVTATDGCGRNVHWHFTKKSYSIILKLLN